MREINQRLREAFASSNESEIKKNFTRLLALFFGVREESMAKETFANLFKLGRGTSKQVLPLDGDVYKLASESDAKFIKDFFVEYENHKSYMSRIRTNLYPGAEDKWLQEASLEALCREYTQHISTEKLSRNSRVATFGSCFASEINNRLVASSIDSETLCLAETFNNPWLNLMLLQAEYKHSPKKGWSIDVKDRNSEYIDFIDQCLKKQFDDPNTHLTRFGRFKHRLAESDLVIYTAGTGFAHIYDDDRMPQTKGMPVISGITGIDKNGNPVHLSKKPIDLSPEEIDSLMLKTWKKIITINPFIKFVYTVSPIPIHGVKLPGNVSAIEFDSTSKARVRLGLELFSKRQLTNTIYWPS